MSRRKSSRVNRQQPDAAELGPDDGSDPKKFHDKRQQFPPGREPGRKAWQLCEQVGRALQVIFPGLADEVLQPLLVVRVEPAPHSGRLMVTVAGPVPADATDPPPVAAHLARATGLLRTEVAAAIHRRKAPEIVFLVSSSAVQT